MNKPVGGRGKQSPYPSKVIRVPEILHPLVEEMIQNLYESGQIAKSCNGFNDNQELEDLKHFLNEWAARWLAKAQGKEIQPRYKFLVQAINELKEFIDD